MVRVSVVASDRAASWGTKLSRAASLRIRVRRAAFTPGLPLRARDTEAGETWRFCAISRMVAMSATLLQAISLIMRPQGRGCQDPCRHRYTERTVVVAGRCR